MVIKNAIAAYPSNELRSLRCGKSRSNRYSLKSEHGVRTES